MGTQQLLLTILGIITVGIAIAVGIWLFTGHSVLSNKDAILNDLQNLGQYAYRYKLKPEPLGGGGTHYTGFNLPMKLSSTENASYASTATASQVTFTATSTYGYGTIVAIVDSVGVLGSFTLSGEFQ